jgi:Ca2+-binding EF-hand superfamily protein
MTLKALSPPLLAALVVAGAGLAVAAQEGPMGPMQDQMGPMQMPGEMFFEAADADGDGKVTAEEFQQYRAERASGLDADGDGKISKEELTAHYERMANARIAAMVDRQIARLDLDGDGMIGVGELAVGLETGGGGSRLFAAADADGDGAVTREEFEVFVADHQGRFHHRGVRDGHGRHGRHDG